jgi:hypothetical protein
MLWCKPLSTLDGSGKQPVPQLPLPLPLPSHPPFHMLVT